METNKDNSYPVQSTSPPVEEEPSPFSGARIQVSSIRVVYQGTDLIIICKR